MNDHHCKHDHRAALGLTLWLTLGFGMLEMVAGYRSNSLSLFSDATHMFSDSAGILVAFVALHLAKSKENELYETWGGLIGGVMVCIMAGWILYQGVLRWNAPESVHAHAMIGVGFVGLLVNLYCLRRLWDSHNDNLNMRAVFLHVLGDALGSVGAMIAGFLVSVYGCERADPGFSVMFSVFILYGGIRVVRDAWLELYRG